MPSIQHADIDHSGLTGVGTTPTELTAIPTSEMDTTKRLRPDGAGASEWVAASGSGGDAADIGFDPTGLDNTSATDVQAALEDFDAAITASGGGGGSLSTVVQDIAADFTTASDSAWHDVTGMTGISLTAGTWIAYVDVETASSGTFGPAFRLSDGTTIYAQAGWLLTNPGTTLSNHLHFASKPFVLGGSATMKLQVFSDTAFTVKKYPSRGGDTSVVATHITFLQIA